MLVIRDAQIRAIEMAMVRRFEQRMLRRLEASFAKQFRRLKPEGMLPIVRLAVARASRHGIEGDRGIFLYMALMLMLGAYFDEDPQLPWAHGRLEDIDRLYAAAMEYLDRVAGPENGYLVRALIRLRDFAPATVDTIPAAQFREEMPAILSRLYPEKAAAQDAEATRAMLDQAAAAARRRGMTGQGDACLFALLAFMLGSGFERDPQVPWVAETLAQPASPPEIVRSLEERARAYIGLSLG